MNLLRAVIGVFACAWSTAALHAVDMTWKYAVQLRATATTNPARVELGWTTDPFPMRHYTVHRKAVGDTTWTEGIPLGSEATSFVDENVETGKIYEYQVIRHGVGYTA